MSDGSQAIVVFMLDFLLLHFHLNLRKRNTLQGLVLRFYHFDFSRDFVKVYHFSGVPVEEFK